jgi:hypothetical protein
MENAEERAVKILQAYFTPLTGRNEGFTGGAFDTFDPSGTRSSSSDRFTADDLVSVSLLSVTVPGRAAIEILERQAERFEDLLTSVGEDRDLADVDSVDATSFPAWKLWEALRELPGLGPTTVSKLMARKRPRLIPVVDSVIREHLLDGSYVYWQPLHAALRANEKRLQRRLLQLRTDAGLSSGIPALRILDVLVWMDGKGYSDRLLEGEPLQNLVPDHEQGAEPDDSI